MTLSDDIIKMPEPGSFKDKVLEMVASGFIIGVYSLVMAVICGIIWLIAKYMK